ncbi:hypothetical protein HKBW3S06_00886, partial [Candidatus Hakubella thermalkaliphila]
DDSQISDGFVFALDMKIWAIF